MFHLFGFILIIIIAVFIIGVSIIGSILRAVFGFGRRSTSNTHTYTTASERQQQQNSQKREEEEENITENDFQSRRHKKIFAKDEGEYVDFEEIKE